MKQYKLARALRPTTERERRRTKVIFVTSSEWKVNETREILGERYTFERQDIDLDEIQAIDVKEVVKEKVRAAYQMVKQPVIVEDTGFYIEAWRGLPGALAKWFLNSVGCEGICRMLQSEKDRRATAETAIGFSDGKTVRVVSAKITGTVPLKPRGGYAFGWDPIFVPKGHTKTFAEMGVSEKNKISMRKLALKKLRKIL